MKRLLFIATVIITLLNLSIKAQSPSIMLEWGKAMGNANIDIASQSATDASGNVYTVGYFGGTVDFDPSASTYTLTSAGAYDMFIQKLDANGNFIWANRIGSTGNEAANTVFVDGSNNIYIGGYYNGTVDFDWNAGNLSLSSGTVQSAFIAKYNSTGNITWLKGLIGTSTSNANSISVDNSGNVYTAGTIGQGVIDFDPNVGVSSFTVTNSGFFVQKLTSAGNLSWAKGFNSATAGCYATTIDLDNAGNPAIGGVFAGSVDFDPNAGVTTYTTFLSSEDAFVIKLNSLGNYDFGFPLGVGSSGGNDADAVNDIEFDASNNLYVCGYFSRTVDFNPSAATNTLTISGGITGAFTNKDAFIAKYSSTGLYNWATNLGIGNSTYIDLASGLAINSSGDAFIGVSNYSSGGSLSSYKLCKFSSSGSLLFFKSFSNIESYDLNIDVAGNLYLAGYVEGSADIDPSTYFSNTVSSIAQKDALIVKFSECTTPASSGPLTGAVALCNGSANSYSISPVVGAQGYAWSTNIGMVGTSTTNIISLTSAQTATTGVISVVGYNHCGNAPTQTLQVTVTPNTTVNVASSSSSVCAGNSVTLTASGATTYSWVSGETTSSIIKNPTSTTVYTVTGYNGNCSNTKTLSINAVALPNMLVTINQATAACAGSPVTLTASGATSYTWNTGALTNTISVTPSVTTVYTVTGVNASGCVKTTTQIVTILSPVLAVSASAYSVCPGGVSTLSVSGASSYTWNGPGGMTNGPVRSVSPTMTSTYIVGGTGVTGCISQTNIVVYVTAAISVSATASSSISCSGSPIIITASGATSYTWNTGAASSTISVSPLTPTIYTVTGASGTCSGTKTISIAAGTTPNMNAVTNNTLLCAGQNANLNVSVTPMIPGMTYTWSTGQTLPGIAVSPSVTTTYTVIGKNMQGCTNTASITQSVSPQIAVSVTTNSTVSCSGSPVILSASGATTYTWNTGSNSNTVSVSPTSNTTYSVTGASGACSNSQTISVNASTNPSLSAVTNNTLLCVSQSALLTANGAGVVSYLWNTGAVSANISVTPTTTTVYSVTGTNAFGCSTTIAITQSVSTCTGLNEAESTTTLFSVYPNPNNGEFTITTTKGVYNIINSIGAIVKTIEVENDTEVIDVKYLSQGIYYIVGKTAKAKIIITK
jgi:hypothetical protein